MDIASWVSVRVLEARFHPASKEVQGFAIVGRVICDQNRASIEQAEIPPGRVKPFDSNRLHEKLEFLVTSIVGDPFRGLLALRSAFWSFVEVPSADGARDRGGP
jgi:hypothetical protein